MITGKEAERIVAEVLHNKHPDRKVYSRGWGEDVEYYAPIVFTNPVPKGKPVYLVNKQTGEVEAYSYRPDRPIAARLEAMKVTKYLFRRVIIRPRRGA
ncbi:hypothetical protein PWJ82_06010 [Actinotignum schaalii]|uniref:hypothetical protein n=1 Tax=Actinotignum schaalii TaxID=59505 RepID=UPI00237E468E|nr:hypothetical protein [Actinotignum schaalii]MDE1654783.1 hypothetical protein [Actinotignum schaalii]